MERQQHEGEPPLGVRCDEAPARADSDGIHCCRVVPRLRPTVSSDLSLYLLSSQDQHSMDRRITIIARYCLLEAMRTRLPALVFATILLLMLAGFFVGAIGITEGTRLQVGFYAASVRFAAVFIVALYVL